MQKEVAEVTQVHEPLIKEPKITWVNYHEQLGFGVTIHFSNECRISGTLRIKEDGLRTFDIYQITLPENFSNPEDKPKLLQVLKEELETYRVHHMACHITSTAILKMMASVFGAENLQIFGSIGTNSALDAPSQITESIAEIEQMYPSGECNFMAKVQLLPSDSSELRQIDNLISDEPSTNGSKKKRLEKLLERLHINGNMSEKHLFKDEGLYLPHGEKIGWGDLDADNLSKLARSVIDPIPLLSQRDSYLNFFSGSGQSGNDMNNPGSEYVLTHFEAVVFPSTGNEPGTIYRVASPDSDSKDTDQTFENGIRMITASRETIIDKLRQIDSN